MMVYGMLNNIVDDLYNLFMYKKLKLCFMGSPEFSVPSLKELLGSGHDIPVVFTQEPKRANRGKKIQKQPVCVFYYVRAYLIRSDGCLTL